MFVKDQILLKIAFLTPSSSASLLSSGTTFFLQSECISYHSSCQEQGLKVLALTYLSPELENNITHYDWPGNYPDMNPISN